MISIQQMQYIVVLSEEQQFQRASERCFVTQPTLSMQIKKAEEQLGYLVFDRDSNPLSLTPAGNSLLPILREILSETEKIKYLSDQLKGKVKEEIRLLPDMTKGRHARTVFVNIKLREELQAYAVQAKFVDRSYPFFASQKSIKAGFSANSLSQTFALLYEGAGLEGSSSHSGRRTFLTNLANKGTAIHILKTLAGHRSISTTAAYLYSSPSQLKAAVELI